MGNALRRTFKRIFFLDAIAAQVYASSPLRDCGPLMQVELISRAARILTQALGRS
jgi:hypothetical protein